MYHIIKIFVSVFVNFYINKKNLYFARVQLIHLSMMHEKKKHAHILI